MGWMGWLLRGRGCWRKRGVSNQQKKKKKKKKKKNASAELFSSNLFLFLTKYTNNRHQ